MYKVKQIFLYFFPDIRKYFLLYRTISICFFHVFFPLLSSICHFCKANCFTQNTGTPVSVLQRSVSVSVSLFPGRSCGQLRYRCSGLRPAATFRWGRWQSFAESSLRRGRSILSSAGNIEKFFICGKMDICCRILQRTAVFQCGECLKKCKVSIFIR